MKKILVATLFSLLIVFQAEAKQQVTLYSISAAGIGAPVGTVTLQDSKYGLLMEPDLSGLQPGIRGFHIHANASCKPADKNGQMIAGLAAGGHFDPENTGQHLGPYNNAGHLGDLPGLFVAADGTASTPILAPRLQLVNVRQHALMVHAGGDNFSDAPKPLGGGGARMYCGVIE